MRASTRRRVWNPSPPTTDVTVRLQGLSAAPSLSGASSIHVRIERLPDTAVDVLLAPLLEAELDVAVTSDAISFQAGTLPLHEAYVLTLTAE